MDTWIPAGEFAAKDFGIAGGNIWADLPRKLLHLGQNIRQITQVG
jgi:hypothetical protein